MDAKEARAVLQSLMRYVCIPFSYDMDFENGEPPFYGSENAKRISEEKGWLWDEEGRPIVSDEDRGGA